jgi:hypothetical protein
MKRIVFAIGVLLICFAFFLLPDGIKESVKKVVDDIPPTPQDKPLEVVAVRDENELIDVQHEEITN